MSPLIYSFGGAQTHVRMHTGPHESDFKKLGARPPVVGAPLI